MTFCPGCGREQGTVAKFCPGCGRAQQAAPPPTPQLEASSTESEPAIRDRGRRTFRASIRISLAAIAWSSLTTITVLGFSAGMWALLKPVQRVAAGALFPDSSTSEAFVSMVLILHQVVLRLPLDSGGVVEYSFAPLIGGVVLVGIGVLVGIPFRGWLRRSNMSTRTLFVCASVLVYAAIGAVLGSYKSVLQDTETKYVVTASAWQAAIAFGLVALLTTLVIARPLRLRGTAIWTSTKGAAYTFVAVTGIVGAANIQMAVSSAAAPARLALSVGQLLDQAILCVERALLVPLSSGVQFIGGNSVVPAGRINAVWKYDNSVYGHAALVLTWAAIVVGIVICSRAIRMRSQWPTSRRTTLLVSIAVAASWVPLIVAMHTAAAPRMTAAIAVYAFPTASLQSTISFVTLSIVALGVLAGGAGMLLPHRSKS